jgi:hypothetical protein
MLRMFASLSALAFALVFATGCSGIRVVHRTSGGGIVALKGPQEGAREKAEAYMNSQCGRGFEIVEEGEAVVGQETTATTRGTFIGPVTTATSTDTREWRITYKCKDADAANAGTKSVFITF